MRRALLTGAAVLVAVAAAAAATGCAGEKSDADVSSDGGGSGKSNVPQVTFRYQSGASYGAVSPFELAQKLGYYDGTSVKIHSVGVSKSGPEDIQAIAAGSNDIASTNTAPIINANKSGLHIKAVVAYGTTVTKDLYGEEVSIGGLLTKRDSGISSAKDLEGKKVSVNVRSAQAEYAIRKWAQDNGADPSKINLVVIAPPNEVQALLQDQVDAAYSWNPAYSKAQEDPGVKLLAAEGEMLGDFAPGGYAFSQEFLDAHPEAVKEFLEGYVKAWKWAWDHPKELQEKAAEIIEDFDGNTELAQYAFPPGSREAALLKDSDIQFYIDQLIDQGDLKEGQIEPTDVYTNEFNPEAP